MSSQDMHQNIGLRDGIVEIGKLFVLAFILVTNHIHFETDKRTARSEKVPSPEQLEVAISPSSVSTGISSSSKLTKLTFGSYPG